MSESFSILVNKPGNLIEYRDAQCYMESIVSDILLKKSDQKLWLLEHDHVYTVGTSGKSDNIIKPLLAPLFHVSRGGKYTYHGPGQRIGYIMVNIKQINNGILDIRKFIQKIENVIIATLANIGITAYSDREKVGIWVDAHKGGRKKIAAIGIKIVRGITTHGFAININNEMNYFRYISPCGMNADSVTSVSDVLRHSNEISIHQIDNLLIKHFTQYFKGFDFRICYH